MNYLYWSPFDLRFKSGQVSQEDVNADQAEHPDIAIMLINYGDQYIQPIRPLSTSKCQNTAGIFLEIVDESIQT